MYMNFKKRNIPLEYHSDERVKDQGGHRGQVPGQGRQGPGGQRRQGRGGQGLGPRHVQHPYRDLGGDGS